MRRLFVLSGLGLLSALLLPVAAFAHLAVAGEENGNRVTVIDVSNPANPRVPATATINTTLNGVQAIAIDPTGSRAVAVEKYGCKVLIIDIISDPNNPGVRIPKAAGPAFCSAFTGVTSVAVSGARALIGEENGRGVQLLDISGNTPTPIPNPLGSVLLLPFTSVSAVAASGMRAVVTEGNGPQVAVINMGASGPLQVMGSPLTTNYVGMSSAAASGARAIVGQKSGWGVQSLTITGSSMPALGTNLYTSLTGGVFVALVGTRALVGEEHGGRVAVVNVVDINSPTPVGQPLLTGFSGVSSVAAVVGMGWIGVVGQKFGPGVRVITGLAGTPALGGTVNTPLIGISSIALTTFPPSSASGHGDPHLTTVDGTHYDFQSAGEFISLRDTDGMEIQTRQTPVATATAIGPDSHTGLTSCVSINTAVAARVGKHRVTYQPNLSGEPDPGGLQLRVDGKLKKLGAQGLNLGNGGRVVKSASGSGIEIFFPNKTRLIATSNWWASQGKWYLNVDIVNTPEGEGLMGAIVPGSWLPALPDGTSMGAIPASLHQRYTDLNQKFADAWRVSDKSSLFDYATGTSTKTFTLDNWPPEKPPCIIPKSTIPPAQPMDPRKAQKLCSQITNKNMRANCIFDVTVTGEASFARSYLVSEKLRLAAPKATAKK